MKRRIVLILIAVIALILALGIALYPILSNLYMEHHQSQIHTQYMNEIQSTDDSTLRDAKAFAQSYNSTLSSGIVSNNSFSKDSLATAANGYDTMLNVTGRGIMGYVSVPKINVTLPIYHGTDSRTLESGIGHLFGTSLPVGGDSTHTVLTAHSGMASQRMFSDLPQLDMGDFYLKVLDETLAYQVDQIKTVLPHDTTYLGIISGQDMCTLVTCTPFGVNSHRLLVRGSRIPYEKAESIIQQQEKSKTTTPSAWETEYLKGIIAGLGIFVLVLTILLIIRRMRRRRREKAK